MSNGYFSQDDIDRAISFHGHWCPGLAMGIRASELALREVGKDGDEDVVALVETDMCAVDAVQFFTGCTFGKGNLKYVNYGKTAFNFFRRSDGHAVRLVLRPHVMKKDSDVLGKLHKKMISTGLTPEENTLWEKTREDLSRRIMEADAGDIFEIKPPEIPCPARARIQKSCTCAQCGETTMESRTRNFDGNIFCIPCFDSVAKGR